MSSKIPAAKHCRCGTTPPPGRALGCPRCGGRRCMRCLGPMEANRIAQRCLECESKPWERPGAFELSAVRDGDREIASRMLEVAELEARLEFRARDGRDAGVDPEIAAKLAKERAEAAKAGRSRRRGR